MSVTIVHTLIEETKSFQLKKLCFFFGNEYKDKVVFNFFRQGTK
jgi:hypothetical protein